MGTEKLRRKKRSRFEEFSFFSSLSLSSLSSFLLLDQMKDTKRKKHFWNSIRVILGALLLVPRTSAQEVKLLKTEYCPLSWRTKAPTRSSKRIMIAPPPPPPLLPPPPHHHHHHHHHHHRRPRRLSEIGLALKKRNHMLVRKQSPFHQVFENSAAKLGGGSFGKVYLSKNQNGDLRAVKVIDGTKSRGNRRQIMAEVKSWHELGEDAPNIVRYYDHWGWPNDGEGNLLCISMQYCSGGTLLTKLRKHLWIQPCSGLSYVTLLLL